MDGMRLWRIKKHLYKHNDMTDLEEKLKLWKEDRLRCIVTDGLFPVDASIAKLDKIV